MSGSSKILAVVDTNLVVSSVISKRGAPYQLMQALYAGRFRIGVTDGIRRRTFSAFVVRFGDVIAEDVAAFHRFLDERSLLVSPLTVNRLPLLVRDPKDNYLLRAALGGNADFLVSGDNDLLVLAGNPLLGRLRIVIARDFLDIIERT